MMPLLRFGITTGLAAAAAAKAAALAALGVEAKAVVVPTPIGLRIEVPVERTYAEGDRHCAEVRKFSGDNPDVLDGVVIKACVKLGGQGVRIIGGRGVGVVTRPGLPVPPGEPAINPVPRMMIEQALREVAESGEVIIEVPGGEELAAKTMNPELGIVGGISILGTTGIEYPVSDEGYIEHVKAELKALRATSDSVALAQGNQSAEGSRRLFGNAVVKIGDLVGDAVRAAAEMGFGKIYVATMPGKLAKLACGALNTHHKYCDCRLASLIYSALRVGVPHELLAKAAGALSVEEALTYLGDYKGAVVRDMAARAKSAVRAATNVNVGIVVFDRGGRLMALLEP
ncbi:cobalamin biosynthesis protein CbiD [Pyrobaculum oguniense TE7]|uniref:Cobalt-precorrin-5B C(1)-methyltransferase n=1 Tax=Pyrobaculum oguniense (strain DSM 13380 / JCM 10595 / TE7) TaxID=698757 RepID=H6QAB3_PYROT|nr:cobalamin biosynthesis protein CbiD [Pyrobaculum oguniense TE7]